MSDSQPPVANGDPSEPESTTESLRSGLDEVAQILFSLRLTITAMERAMADDPAHVLLLLASIRKQTDMAIAKIRLLAIRP